MLSTRVLPCLLLKGQGLVKTVKFKDPTYLGDSRNVMRIFNEREVDGKIVVLDISATPEKRSPSFDLVQEIVSEAFMPVGYGGGIRDLEDARRLIRSGVEKIIINTYAVENPGFIREAADVFGSQSVVVCIDVKKGLFGKYECYTHGGRKNARIDPVTFAREVEKAGAGELIINSIDRDGTMQGYDINLIRMVATSVQVPIVACGGAGKLEHFREAVREGHASAVAAGSMFVFHGRHRAVLISYPDQKTLRETFEG